MSSIGAGNVGQGLLGEAGREVDPLAVAVGTGAAGVVFVLTFAGPLSLWEAVFAGSTGAGVVAGAASRSFDQEFLDGALATVAGSFFTVALFAGWVLVGGPGVAVDPALSVLVFGWGIAAGLAIVTFPLGLALGAAGAALGRRLR